MKTLKEIFSETGNFTGQDIGCNDKGGLHSYIDTYDKILEPYRNGSNILEIGIAMGHSIRMWDEYFEKSIILGVDISLMIEQIESKRNIVRLIESDATQKEFLDKVGNITFDVVIDDGEHTHQSQIATFNLLKNKINKGGVYIIEDILNIDVSWQYLKTIHNNCEVVDLRNLKGRFDDVLLIYHF